MDEERAIGGELRVLRELNPYEFEVKLILMRSGENRNRWDYQNIDKYYRTFAGQPILVAYTMNGKRVGDGHNMELRRDPRTGEAYYSFTSGTAERIVGTISDDPDELALFEEGGETWIEAKGRIFRFYARELVDKIIGAGTMSVSVETEIHREHENEQGVSVFEEWTGLGVTILGDGVAPAVPGARITALQAMAEEFEGLKLRAASLRESAAEGKNTDKEVRKRMNHFNKTQLAALADRFTGWIVVCAAKDENGVYVGLRNDKGEFARYTMNSEADTFAPERVEKIAVMADFGGGLCADVGDIVAELHAGFATNAALLEAVTADRDAKDETIRAMQAREDVHRTAEGKRVAAATLAAFNANRADKVEDAVLNAVNADIENGVYTNSVNDAGEWTGDAEIAKAVKALCADAVAAQDKARAEANRRSYIWESARMNEAEADDGSLKALLSRMSAE